MARAKGRPKGAQTGRVLIQVLVPPELHEWVQGEATRVGETVSSWVRRLIGDHRQARANVRAFCWAVSPPCGETTEYLLTPIREIPGSGQVFELRRANGVRFSDDAWMRELPYLRPDDVVFVVTSSDGVPAEWRFECSMFRTDGVLEVTLSPRRKAS